MATRDAILAALHFISIFGVVGTLVAELMLLRPALIAQTGRWIARLDAAFGLAAAAAIVTGVSRAVWGAKGWAFYAHNPAFHTKMTVFALIGILSIWPTVLFLRWSRGYRKDPAFQVPAVELVRARRVVMIEVHLLVLLPILASMMSRGLWF